MSVGLVSCEIRSRISRITSELYTKHAKLDQKPSENVRFLMILNSSDLKRPLNHPESKETTDSLCNPS